MEAYPSLFRTKNLMGRLRCANGGQFLNVELEAAVAIHADGSPAPAGQAHADACRQTAKPIAPSPAVWIDALSGARRTGEQENLDAAAGTAGDQQVVRLGFLPDDFGQVIDADAPFGLAMLGAAPPGSASSNRRSALSTRRGPSARWRSPGAAFRAGNAPASAQIGRVDVRRELADLGRIDIHHHFVRGAGELIGRVAGDGEIQARADAQQEIAILQREVGAARRQRTGTPDKQRIFATK